MLFNLHGILLATFQDDFGLLTNLVKIDLSGNALTFLPESFGQLIQLQHLDLYKNELTVSVFIIISGDHSSIFQYAGIATQFWSIEKTSMVGH